MMLEMKPTDEQVHAAVQAGIIRSGSDLPAAAGQPGAAAAALQHPSQGSGQAPPAAGPPGAAAAALQHPSQGSSQAPPAAGQPGAAAAGASWGHEVGSAGEGSASETTQAGRYFWNPARRTFCRRASLFLTAVHADNPGRLKLVGKGNHNSYFCCLWCMFQVRTATDQLQQGMLSIPIS